MKIGHKTLNIALFATLSCVGVVSSYNLVDIINKQGIKNSSIEKLREKNPTLVENLQNFQRTYIGGGLKKDEFIEKRVLETQSSAPLDSAIAAEKAKALKHRTQIIDFFKNIKNLFRLSHNK